MSVYDRNFVRQFADPSLSSDAPRYCYCPTCYKSNGNRVPKVIRLYLFRRHVKEFGDRAHPPRPSAPLPIEVDAKQDHPAPPLVQQAPGPLLGDAIDELGDAVDGNERQQENAKTPAVLNPALVRDWSEVPDGDLPQAVPRLNALEAEIQIISEWRRALSVHAIKNPQNPQNVYIEVCPLIHKHCHTHTCTHTHTGTHTVSHTHTHTQTHVYIYTLTQKLRMYSFRISLHRCSLHTSRMLTLARRCPRHGNQL
jgi:hypothetical protein